jgi:hypothetical protein
MQQIDPDQLFYIQWASMDLLINPMNYISTNVPKISSMRDLNPLNIYAYPELGYYVRNIENNTIE